MARGEINIKIKYSTEKEDGTYVFQGELSGPELDLIVECGLNTLLMQGALPFATEEQADEASFYVPENGTTQ